jgi:hypothetical protein
LALQKNHLSGLQRKLLKVSFYNVQQLMEVRKEIQPTVNRNSKRSTMADAVAALAQQGATSSGRPMVSQQLVGGCGDNPTHSLQQVLDCCCAGSPADCVSLAAIILVQLSFSHGQ